MKKQHRDAPLPLPSPPASATAIHLAPLSKQKKIPQYISRVNNQVQVDSSFPAAHLHPPTDASAAAAAAAAPPVRFSEE